MKTWISVNDRMPDKDEHVLVAFDDGFIATVSTDDLGDWELWADSGEPTHWMPLPEPPGVEQMTNGDRIRMFSNELLAQVLICPNDAVLDDFECPKISCLRCTYDWLNAEERDV